MSTDEIDRMGLLAEVHFDFDKSDVREADRAILAKNADVLKKFDFLRVTVEGHCDERGTVEYNLALGERRAKAGLRLPGLARRRGRPPEDGLLRQGGPGLPRVQRGLLGAQPPGTLHGHRQDAVAPCAGPDGRRTTRPSGARPPAVARRPAGPLRLDTPAAMSF